MSVFCEEREELARLIHTCAVQMSENAHEASNLAAGTGKKTDAGEDHVFLSMKLTNERLTARAKALRQALEIHRRIHGC
jgi:hypothetical protein